MLEGYISSAVMVMATTIAAVSMKAPFRCALGACMYTVCALCMIFRFLVYRLEHGLSSNNDGPECCYFRRT